MGQHSLFFCESKCWNITTMFGKVISEIRKRLMRLSSLRIWRSAKTTTGLEADFNAIIVGENRKNGSFHTVVFLIEGAQTKPH